MQSKIDNQIAIDEVLNSSMRIFSREHKVAITTELNKRQERKKEELRLKQKEEEERQKRKEKRAALRERHRLDKLKELIHKEIVLIANNEEYTPAHKVYDLGAHHATNDGVVVIGGFVGELILTFTCLLDYILASPANQNFMFTIESIEQFLKDLLGQEESTFPDKICSVSLNRPLDQIVTEENLKIYELTGKQIRESENLADFGLRFMLDIQKDLVLSTDVIEVIFSTIAKIATAKPIPMQPLPEIPDDAPDSEKQTINESIEHIKVQNEVLEKENKNLEKLQTKVSIQEKQPPKYDEGTECALIRMNNFQEGEPQPSARSGEEETFNPDKIPTKVTLTKPVGKEIQTLFYHAEAPYLIRKLLIEQARKSFKELEKAELNALLSHSFQRTKLMEERLEESLIRDQGYGRGCQYSTPSLRTLFKTFLQE